MTNKTSRSPLKKTGSICIFICTIVFLTLAIGGCGSGGSSDIGLDNQSNTSLETIINPAAKVLPTDGSVNIEVDADDPNILKLSGNVPELATDDIIVSASGTGLLRKVVSVQRNGDVIIVQTDIATLPELFYQVDINQSIPLDTSNLESITNVPEGVTITASEQAARQSNVDINNQNKAVFDVLISKEIIEDRLKVDGKVSLELRSNFIFQTKGKELTKYEATFPTKLTGSVSVKAFDKMDVIKEKVKIGSFRWKPIITMVSAVPFVVVPQTDIYIEIEGSVTTAVEFKPKFTFSLEPGTKLENGNIVEIDSTPVYNFEFGGVAGSGLDASVEAKIKYSFLGVKQSLLIYGLMGPYVDLSSYLSMSSKYKLSALNEIEFDMKLGLEGLLGAKVTLLKKDLLDYESPWKLDIAAHIPPFPITYNYGENTAQASPLLGVAPLSVALTCTPKLSEAQLEGRCNPDESWLFISPGSSLPCTYSTPGSYYPSCRFAGDTVVPVASPVVVLSASAVCGNSAIEAEEQCDDGNTSSGDGCSSTCQTEAGAVCGNSIFEVNEQCDDGNTTSGDGCSSTCQTEAGPECGNSYVDSGEQCDDGNTVSGDGCSSSCTTETPTNQLPAASASVNTTTGVAPLDVNFTGGCTDTDGACISYIWDFDDGTPTNSSQNPNHTFNNAGVYTATLTVTDNNGGTGQVTVTITVLSGCGNGIVESGEICDDGNTTGGDGCSSICTTELANIDSIAAGEYYTCALTTSGGVKCWGTNTAGQLGDGTTTNRLTPVDVIGLSSGVIAISAGADHTCALTTTGGVKCWGGGYIGDGDGSNTLRLTPVDVVGLTSGVAAISAGDIYTCALTTTGGMKCWGNNISGRLGDGTTTTRLTPVDVSGLSSGVIAISAGGTGNTCALTTGGGVKCWGNNGIGQLGDGTTTTRLTPVDVVGLTSGVIAVSRGKGAQGAHTCALMTSGGIKCWGTNNAGVLGDGTMINRSTPVDVVGLTSEVAAISTGDTHTCALTTTGGVICWGAGGELGDGTVTTSFTPVEVFGLTSGVTAIEAGRFFTCALTTSGGVKCWGDNSVGQLGDGTTTNRLTPVVVDSN